MNTDHYFAIGHTHEVCEDYALSGTVNNLGYAIVCDGCSASEGVDFGARALAFAAKTFITQHTDVFFSAEAEDIGTLIVRHASLIGNFSVPASALDATLVMAVLRGDKLRICLWGDGVAAIRKPKGSTAYHVNYASGAPFYLSYRLNPTRRLAYDSEFNQAKQVDYLVTGNPPLHTQHSEEYWKPTSIALSAVPGDVVLVSSDGINSYRKPDTEPIPWETVLDEFTGFKSTNGVFVTRRMKFFANQCAKNQTTHDDDISVAAIVV